jgi:nicotinate-nucleotide adenylyltransferase
MLPFHPNKGALWGIMGGVFDPIHYGHLILAQCALQKFNYEGILFIPSFNPPHRAEKPVAVFDNRYMMTRLAIEGNEKFAISDLERDLKSPGYTLAIVDFLNQKYPGVVWHLILGADNLTQLDSWHKPEELIERVKIVVGNRPGFDQEFEKSKWFGRVEQFPMPLIEISSTAIRNAVREGLTIRYLVPEEVRQFIESRGLYR